MVCASFAIRRTCRLQGAPTSSHTSNRMTIRSDRIEVITRGERRRAWAAYQKREIAMESLAPGALATEVARKHKISTGQLCRVNRGWPCCRGAAYGASAGTQLTIALKLDQEGCGGTLDSVFAACRDRTIEQAFKKIIRPIYHQTTNASKPISSPCIACTSPCSIGCTLWHQADARSGCRRWRRCRWLMCACRPPMAA